MTIVKQIICLACSRKRSGLCIAGKERLEDGTLAWIRPVSDRPDEEISDRQSRFADGSRPSLLDVIDITLVGHHPNAFQTENWLVQPRERWRRSDRRAEWRHLARLADQPLQLWENGLNTVGGVNDRVAAADTAGASGSLLLLHLGGLTLNVSVPGPASHYVEPRLQAAFSWRGVLYRLRVTDPEIERDFLMRDARDYPVGECYATVSLGLPYKGYCYKLVAAVFLPPAG